jgi:hypothetical protein
MKEIVKEVETSRTSTNAKVIVFLVVPAETGYFSLLSLGNNHNSQFT